MSTKIYNGIKFNSNNLYEILKQLTAIKSEAALIGTKALKEQLPLFIADNDLLFEESFKIINQLMKDLNKSARTIWGPSVLFSVVVLPHKNGEFYGFYLDDNIREYSKLLFDNNIAVDFHYQNQTDQPKNISKKDWDDRDIIWGDLTAYGSTWAENGFELSIVIDRVCYNLRPIIKIIQRKIISRMYRHMWE